MGACIVFKPLTSIKRKAPRSPEAWLLPASVQVEDFLGMIGFRVLGMTGFRVLGMTGFRVLGYDKV